MIEVPSGTSVAWLTGPIKGKMMDKDREKMSDDAFTFLCFMIVSAVIVLGVTIYKLWSA